MKNMLIHKNPQQLQHRIAELKRHIEKFNLACDGYSSAEQDTDDHLDRLEHITDGIENYAFLLRSQLNPESIDSTNPYYGYSENYSRYQAMSETEKDQSWASHQDNLQHIQQAEQAINQQLDNLIAEQEKNPDFNGDALIDKIMLEQKNCNEFYLHSDTLLWESVPVAEHEPLGLFDNIHLQRANAEEPVINDETTLDIQETLERNEEQELLP